jgi:hypothetical protein
LILDADEDKKLYGHLFGDEPAAEGSGDEDSEEADLLDSDEELEDDDDQEDEYFDADKDEAVEESDDNEMDQIFGRNGFASGSSDDAGSGSGEDEEEGEDGPGSDRHRAMLEAVVGKSARELARERRQRRSEVVTEVYPESEYNLPAPGEQINTRREIKTTFDCRMGAQKGRSKEPAFSLFLLFPYFL